MIKAGIIGSTGYAGQELVRLLLGHKDVEIVWYGSRSYIDKKYYDVFRRMQRRQYGRIGGSCGCDFYGNTSGTLRLPCQ